MVIPPDFGFLRGWLTTQHYEHEYPSFFVSSFHVFPFSSFFSLALRSVCSLSSSFSALLDISLAAWLALLQKLFDGGLGHHLKRTHTHIVDTSLSDMQVAWWFASSSS